MAAPPPDYLNLANGMRETAQEFARVAQHPPLTLADLQQQLQQQLQQLQSQQLLQQIQDQLERSYVLHHACSTLGSRHPDRMLTKGCVL